MAQKPRTEVDYVCFVDVGYPGHPFDQDLATNTLLDFSDLPGEYAPGTEPSATPEATDLINTTDGHKATLSFEDGYVATVAISPYGAVLIFDDFAE